MEEHSENFSNFQANSLSALKENFLYFIMTFDFDDGTINTC